MYFVNVIEFFTTCRIVKNHYFKFLHKFLFVKIKFKKLDFDHRLI